MHKVFVTIYGCTAEQAREGGRGLPNLPILGDAEGGVSGVRFDMTPTPYNQCERAAARTLADLSRIAYGVAEA